jgi:hypothetical protein
MLEDGLVGGRHWVGLGMAWEWERGGLKVYLWQ